MSTPDLPMRERIAEALNLAGWTCSGGIHEPGLFHECEDCRETCLAQADAVLAVLADLPDTAVEAGVEATRLHRVSVEHDGDYGETVFLECRCGWGPSDNGDTPAMWAKAYAHENHERQAATIAAIKEGKA